MSLTQTINYDNASNFTFDSDLIEISGSQAQLVKQEGETDYTEDFADDTGFTYDSAKAEFSNGQIQQKSQVPADALSYATYSSDEDLDYGGGTLAGTLAVNASVSGGYLNVDNDDLSRVEYDATSNADAAQTGCIELIVQPNYSGSPTNNQSILYVTKTASLNNRINLYHFNTGNVQAIIRDSSGSTVVSIASAWSPTSGVDYEFSLNWDLTSGASRLFIDGNQIGSTDTSTATRTSDVDDFYVGSDGATNANFKIKDVIFYDAVKRTANYTPGYTLSPTQYVTSAATLPEMQHTGVGTFLAFTDFATTANGSVRFTCNVGQSGTYQYWNGAAWVSSNRTYAQANDSATMTTKLPLLSVNDEEYIQFELYFTDTDTQANVSNLVVTLNEEKNYPTSDPTITVNSGVAADGLVSFSESGVTETGDDEVRYALVIGGTDHYWTGSSWGTSAGYSETNTASEINDNAEELDISDGAIVRVKTYLHSDNGSTTPSIETNVLGYDFYEFIGDIDVTNVYGYVVDGATVVQGAAVRFYTISPVFYDDRLYSVDLSAKTDSNGYYEKELPYLGASNTMSYFIEFTDATGFKKKKTGTILVPDPNETPNVPLEDIIQ